MKKTEKVLYWAPRILSILFICFLFLFSLDVYKPGMAAKDVAVGMFMHNIPVLILIILLVIAWRREIVGVVSFIGIGILYTGFVALKVVDSEVSWNIAITWILPIAAPAIIIGILFLINMQNNKTRKGGT